MRLTFLSDFNIVGTKKLRNELHNFSTGDCQHVFQNCHLFFLPVLICWTMSHGFPYRLVFIRYDLIGTIAIGKKIWLLVLVHGTSCVYRLELGNQHLVPLILVYFQFYVEVLHQNHQTDYSPAF